MQTYFKNTRIASRYFRRFFPLAIRSKHSFLNDRFFWDQVLPYGRGTAGMGIYELTITRNKEVHLREIEKFEEA